MVNKTKFKKSFQEGLFFGGNSSEKKQQKHKKAQKFVYKNSKNKKKLTFSDTDTG